MLPLHPAAVRQPTVISPGDGDVCPLSLEKVPPSAKGLLHSLLAILPVVTQTSLCQAAWANAGNKILQWKPLLHGWLLPSPLILSGSLYPLGLTGCWSCWSTSRSLASIGAWYWMNSILSVEVSRMCFAACVRHFHQWYRHTTGNKDNKDLLDQALRYNKKLSWHISKSCTLYVKEPHLPCEPWFGHPCCRHWVSFTPCPFSFQAWDGGVGR